MKQPPFGTRLRISRLCRVVMALAAVKVAFLGSMVLHNMFGPHVAEAELSVTPLTVAASSENAPAPEMGSPLASSQSSGTHTVSGTLAEKNLRLVDTAVEGGKMAQAFLAELSVPTDRQGGGNVQADPADPQFALANASSLSAMTMPRLLGTSVAYAAGLPPVQPVVPPAPTVRPMASPLSPERVVRPDEVAPQAPPAPAIAPFVSRDSAVQKQAELNRREQELLALQQQMEARMVELHTLEGRLQGMLHEANTTQDSKFKQLVDMYANMKPRVAAQALTTVDEDIAVKILTGMKSKQSGEIMSYMDPLHAARLSEVMSKMQM